MAVKQPGVWGIDLGQCALKAIRLEMKDNQVVATAFEYIEHPKILSQPDADPDELTREALNQFLSRNQIRGDIIAISVPGQSGLARFVKLPPVDEKKIADIVKFEAKQQIPFPLEEVVWDFQRLNKGDIIDGLALETEIGLFAMKRDMVNRAIAQFKDVNVEVHMVQMAPLALCNFIAYDLLGKEGGQLAEEGDSHECIVALEIGTDASNLVITDGGRIIWQRPIPIGGNHFTRALTKELKLTFAKAEHLKKNAAKMKDDLKKILSSLKQVLNDFVGEVQRSLGYFTNTHRNATIQYMVGLGNAFRLPGLQKFLQEKLQLEVRKLQKLERTTGESVTTAPNFAENIMSFGVAYGLALQGLKQAHLQTNLLPYEVRLERVIRGKKPWVVAAAASLIFGMCILAFAEGMEKSRVINKDNKAAAEDVEKVIKQAADFESAKKAKEEELTKHLVSLNQISAGVNERINWQLLHQYVNMASPQPNGDRLAIKDHLDEIGNIRKRYWENSADAQKAFELLEKIKVKDKDVTDLKPDEAAKQDKFIKKNLIQINITGINALYAEDLGPYYRKIYKDSETLLGMIPKDKAQVVEFVNAGDDAAKQKDSPLLKDKDGKESKDGWIVEVRGFTYHKDADKFVKESFIRNLRYPGELKSTNPEAQKELNELARRIERNVSYLHIYHQGQVNPGQPSMIGKSYLRPLVRGIAAAAPDKDNKPAMAGMQGGPPPGMAMAGMQGGVGGDKGKPSRDNWQPLGETVAYSIFGDNALAGGAGGGMGGMAGGGIGGAPPPVQKVGGAPPPGMKGFPMPPNGELGKTANPQGVVRTEFIVLFTWREPISAQQTIVLEEKK